MTRRVYAQNNDQGSTRDETAPARAVIYVRVSTKEQAEMGGEAEGFSIPAQRAACLRKAEGLGAVGVIGRGVMRVPSTKSRISGTIGDGEFVVSLRLLDCLDRRSQVRSVIQRNLVIVAERLNIWA